MLVIRPDDGAARLEDSGLRIAEAVSPKVLAEQIASGSPVIGGLTLNETAESDPVRADWLAKGWRPSLEYFDWSEEDWAGGSGGDLAPEPAAKAVGSGWNWGELAERAPASQRTVGDVLVRRRTARSYDPSGLDQTSFAGILHDFFALMDATRGSSGFRAGLKFAAIVYGVNGLTSGVWNLHPATESATLAKPGQLRQALCDLMCGMQAAQTAAATVVLVADFPQRQHRFPYDRALRELYIEVGRIAQWLIVACEARGAGCLITPATNDKVFCEVLGLPPHQAPVYTITFGPRKPPKKS
jgi:nitroreductase